MKNLHQGQLSLRLPSPLATSHPGLTLKNTAPHTTGLSVDTSTSLILLNTVQTQQSMLY